MGGSESPPPAGIFSCHRGYLWVRLYRKYARRAVAIHRIVWMVHHKRIVPRGHFIHHAGCKRLNRIEELHLVTRGEHKKIHAQRDQAALEEFLNAPDPLARH